MCTICDFSVGSGKPDLTESTSSSTFQSSSSTRASLEGMPKSLTRPDSGMLEPGLTQSQRPECNTSNIAAVAAGILASAVSTNSKSAAVDAGSPASAASAIAKLNPLSTILLHRVFLMRWNRLSIQHFCNGCLTLSNQQSSNFRCIITWSSNTKIGLSQFSGNLSLQTNLKCTNTRLSQFSGNLSLQTNLKCTNTRLSQFSGNLSLQTNLKCTNTRLSQFSGNLSLQTNLKCTNTRLSQFSGNLSLQTNLKCTITWLSQFRGNLSLQSLIFWSSILRRPITNQLQRLNYLVVYPGGHSLIGKNDFYHFLFQPSVDIYFKWLQINILHQMID